MTSRLGYSHVEYGNAAEPRTGVFLPCLRGKKTGEKSCCDFALCPILQSLQI